MAYTKNPTWVDGTAGGTRIDAADLNNIEDGIEAAHALAEAASVSSMANPYLRWPTGGVLGYYYSGWMQVAPMPLYRAMSFTSLTIVIQVAQAGDLVRVGFWRLTGDMSGSDAFTLVDQVGPFDASTTGNKTISGLSITLPKGPLWAGGVSGGAQFLLRSAGIAEPTPYRGNAGSELGQMIQPPGAPTSALTTSGTTNNSNAGQGAILMFFGGVTYP